MEITFKLLLGAIALIHIIFLTVEMFFWQSDFVQKKLMNNFTLEEQAAILARNQGLYNGFVAAGLIWVLFLMPMFPQVEAHGIGIFFLVCVAIAGIYASFTLKRPTAFLIQSLPAILALGLFALMKY